MYLLSWQCGRKNNGPQGVHVLILEPMNACDKVESANQLACSGGGSWLSGGLHGLKEVGEEDLPAIASCEGKGSRCGQP